MYTFDGIKTQDSLFIEEIWRNNGIIVHLRIIVCKVHKNEVLYYFKTIEWKIITLLFTSFTIVLI